MRNTLQVRDEVFRRAEHKRIQKRRMYRRMGSLCVMLCLCGSLLVWGMMGSLQSDTPSEKSGSSLNGILEGESTESSVSSVPLESIQEASAEQGDADSQAQESLPYEEDYVISEEPDAEPPGDAPEYSGEEGTTDSDEKDDLPTVVLLAVNASTSDGLTTYTLQGVLTQGAHDFDAGDSLPVDLPASVKLYGGESILAVGEWQDGIFVVERHDYLLFGKNEEMGGDSSSDAPPEDEDVSEPENVSRLRDLLAMAGTFVPESLQPSVIGEELFEALKVLYN